MSTRHRATRQKPCHRLAPKTNFYGWHLSEHWHRLLAEGWREWACGYTSMPDGGWEDGSSSSKRV